MTTETRRAPAEPKGRLRAHPPVLETAFEEVYAKFKLHFYQQVFFQAEDREDGLTTSESFCMETIVALGRPSIHRFASFLHISQPNAAYKVNRLLRKGYLKKVQSQKDKREFFLCPTPKYMEYYNAGNSYARTVMQRIRHRFSTAEVRMLEEMLHIISTELMGEIALPERRTKAK